MRNRNILTLSDNGKGPSGINHKGDGNNRKNFYDYGKTGQYINGGTEYKTESDGNTNYISNALNHSGGNEQHRNGLTNSLGYGTYESHQYKELSGRLSRIQKSDRGAYNMQQSSLNDQNMISQGVNEQPLATVSESLDSRVDSLLRRSGTKDESYHYETIYGKMERRHRENQTSYADENGSGVVEREDEENIDGCSDQEFR